MSKEHAYAYESGYRDGSIHYELEHCPACKNVADLQEALADNAKLREQIHWLKHGDILHVLTDQEYIDQCEREHLMQVSIDALDNENAKLRELVARMAEALGIDCEWADPNWCKSPCVLEFGCWPNDEHAEIRCPAWAAMCELGVGVDE